MNLSRVSLDTLILLCQQVKYLACTKNRYPDFEPTGNGSKELLHHALNLLVPQKVRVQARQEMDDQQAHAVDSTNGGENSFDRSTLRFGKFLDKARATLRRQSRTATIPQDTSNSTESTGGSSNSTTATTATERQERKSFSLSTMRRAFGKRPIESPDPTAAHITDQQKTAAVVTH